MKLKLRNKMKLNNLKFGKKRKFKESKKIKNNYNNLLKYYHLNQIVKKDNKLKS